MANVNVNETYKDWNVMNVNLDISNWKNQTLTGAEIVNVHKSVRTMECYLVDSKDNVRANRM
jgi:hypothetical protein